MALLRLDAAVIADWPSFHTECARLFEFPDFYGHNMNAWIDCLSYLRDEEGMTKFHLAPDEVLQIDILQHNLLRATIPGLLEELQDCIAFLNDRYADYGEKPALQLVLS